MELTRHQEDFIHKLLDFYCELHEPFHYSQLAERLGISPFIAYDMLRLFEKKGDGYVAVPSNRRQSRAFPS